MIVRKKEVRLKKFIDEMDTQELRELVDEMIDRFGLYSCEKCGRINRAGYICYYCEFDGSN